jgi:hypothetical protein
MTATSWDDPLHLDRWFMNGPPLAQRNGLDAYAELIRIAEYPTPQDPDMAMAALRDVDFPLCLAERYGVPWRTIPDLEMRLIHLGKAADHIPRGCNHTYGVTNPPGQRRRTFTRLEAEHDLIEALRTGGVAIGGILSALRTLAVTRDGLALHTAARSLPVLWEPMTESAVRMARVMPLKVFSRDIIPWLVPLEIGGVTYRAPTGAQFSNMLIDWALWGVDLDSPSYREYALAFMLETPAVHRELVDEILAATGGRSLLAVLPGRLAALDTATAFAVLDGIEGLLKRIRDFRAVHGRFARTTLEMRAADVGSGMQNEDQFGPLLTYTREAYASVRRMRAVVAARPRLERGTPGTKDQCSAN